MTRASSSLVRKTTIALVATSFLACAVAALPIYLNLGRIPVDDGLEDVLVDVAARLAALPSDAPHTLPEDLGRQLSERGVRLVVTDDQGAVLTASEAGAGVLRPPSKAGLPACFESREPGSRPLFGCAQAGRLWGQAVWVEVSTQDSDLYLDFVIGEVVEHVTLAAVFSIVLQLGVSLWVFRRGLRPVVRASGEAASIGPETLSSRLTEADLPREVLPLVRAVNQCLERLERGYERQKAFVADAAHELRTPLAVLKAQVDTMGDRKSAQVLETDLSAMSRLVQQLLAIARVDALQITDADQVDLGQLVLDVAVQIGPLAIRHGRSIEVIGGDRSVLVRGVHDFLFRAVRNLVENALRHTPAGTNVVLTVCPYPPGLSVRDHGPGVPVEAREMIFKRFWRGTRDRAGAETGVGLGMAIVAQTMESHGGRVEIADAPGGGAEIRLLFPQPEARPA